MGILNKKRVEDPECPNLDWEGQCEQCNRTVSRFRGEGDITCECGAEYNCGGQQLRDDWRSNRSNWDDEVGDMEGFEQAALRREGADW